VKPLTVLAWDTATDRCAAALVRAGGPAGGLEILAEYAGGVGFHSQLLPPRLALMLRENGLGPADLDLLTVGRGPGSFTGLRTGLALAKGLALGAGRPALGLGTLEVLATQMLAAEPDPDLLAAPVIDARHREVFTALYQRVGPGGALTPLLSPRPLAPEALAAALAEAGGGRPVKVDGPARPLVEAVSAGSGPVRIEERGAPLPVSASVLAGLGAAIFRTEPEGGRLPPPLPLYIRLPDLRPAGAAPG
jgi:tRNA threonylcarbamoyl adenosine modification protein YeaZ